MKPMVFKNWHDGWAVSGVCQTEHFATYDEALCYAQARAAGFGRAAALGITHCRVTRKLRAA